LQRTENLLMRVVFLRYTANLIKVKVMLHILHGNFIYFVVGWARSARKGRENARNERS
jgi:hypothetical protein